MKTAFLAFAATLGLSAVATPSIATVTTSYTIILSNCR